LISIIDCGISNFGSIQNMLKKIGEESIVITSPVELEKATKVILPGVGSFDHGMGALNESGMSEAILKIDKSIPILGICLGMQLMSKRSEEGVLDGLGIIDAECKRIHAPKEANLKVPHMGWNTVHQRKKSLLLSNFEEDSRFYFVHSYYVECNNESDVLASSYYGVEFSSMIQHGNIYGVQFHPEKSHRFGINLFQKFSKL